MWRVVLGYMLSVERNDHGTNLAIAITSPGKMIQIVLGYIVPIKKYCHRPELAVDKLYTNLLAGAVEYASCIFAQGLDSATECPVYDSNWIWWWNSAHGVLGNMEYLFICNATMAQINACNTMTPKWRLHHHCLQ